MKKKLQLSPAATITTNHQGVLLQSDLGDFQLHGKDVSEFIHHILPLLDGRFEANEIWQQLTQYSESSVQSILDLLFQKGLIESLSEQPEFAPPWPSHERFLNAWSSTQKQSSSTLQNMKILVVGLEPWAMTMVDELAIAGVGTIHVLDNDNITKDELLYYRGLKSTDLSTPRTYALQQRLSESAAWCQFTSEKLQLGSDKSLVISAQDKWDLVIVSLSKEAQFWLTKTSEYIHSNKLTALYGHLDGLESWLGPLVTEENHSCWNCMRLRRLGTSFNPKMAHDLDKVTSNTMQTSRSRSMLSSMSALTGQQLAMESIKVLLKYTPSNLHSHVRVHNIVTGESKSHKIIPVPWCDVCGHDHFEEPPKPSHHSTHTAAMSAVSANAHSTHQLHNNPLNNIANLEQLKTLFAGWIDPVTGIIRQLSGHSLHLPDFPITASAGVSSFTAGDFDPRSMGQIGSGKGLDEISAHISAIGEAIERYSAARFNKSNCKYANISQLQGEYVDPTDLVLYSRSQYRTPNFPFSRWRAKQKIHWTKGNWIGTKTPVWVPALVSYFNFSSPYEEQFSQVSSNGLAAGQNNEDAAIRATYELIERDAMMLTWYAQAPCQRLKIDSQYDGKMRLLIDNITQRGIKLELYLLDVGIHVPTVVCLAFGDGQSTPAVSVALATHGDINIAMRKALLEQGHVMPYLCHLMGTGQRTPMQVQDVQSLEDHAAYYFSEDKKKAFDFMRKSLDSAITPEQWRFPKIAGIGDLRQRLLSAGVDIAIVDVTAPDVALSPFRVARAVGINMQPIHFGEQFKRIDNPRLRSLLNGRNVNNNPHPIA